jgi:hypothetical protein
MQPRGLSGEFPWSLVVQATCDWESLVSVLAFVSQQDAEATAASTVAVALETATLLTLHWIQSDWVMVPCKSDAAYLGDAPADTAYGMATLCCWQ